MPSIEQVLTDAADMASTVRAGLQVVERVAGDNKNADTAISALTLIEAVVKALHRGLAGDLHAADVLKEVDTLHKGLVTNDGDVRSEIDKKFPTG